eukprot:3506703-Pleurochrysis_carterae.AAC.1
MNSGSLTVAAEDPARFAAFEGAIVVELVGEDPLGLADERVLGALNEVKGIVCYFALEICYTSCAPLYFVRAAERGYPCSSWVEVEHQRRWLPWCEDRATCRRRSLQE